MRETSAEHEEGVESPYLGTDLVKERAHRVGGTRCDSKPRKIVARFLNYKDREAVFKAKKKLHGTNMFVNEDYSNRVIKRRTELMPKLKEARRKNQRAFLRFDKLVIYDNPVNSGSTNHESDQENLVTPIDMTCYLCSESLGFSLCNYCKCQFPFHDLDDNAYKVNLKQT